MNYTGSISGGSATGRLSGEQLTALLSGNCVSAVIQPDTLVGFINYGNRGPKGEQGVSIETVLLNENNSFVISLSNGTTVTTDPIHISGSAVDYETLTNLPQINNVEIIGNLSTSDLNISYDDLKDLPTIPEIPTNVSYFNNDAGYLTEHQDISDKADITYVDEEITRVENSMPVIPTYVSAFQNDAGYLTTHQSLDSYRIAAEQDVIDATKVNATDLASVAFSGDYDSLSNKPTIPTVPTDVSEFNNDAGYITSSYHDGTKQDVIPDNTFDAYGAAANVQSNLTSHTSDDVSHITAAERTAWNAKSNFSGDYNDLTNKPTIPTVPTTISSFTNDSGYITSSYHDSTKQDTLTAGANITIVGNTISAAASTQLQADWEQDNTASADYIKNKPIIPTVPTNVSSFTNDAGYLTSHQSLADYSTTSQMNSAIAAYHDSSKANTADLAAVATSGNYADLSNTPTIPAAQVNSDWNSSSGVSKILNKPTIPSKVSQLQNDSGFTTNVGTVTGIKMNGSSKGTSGVVDLGTVITSHQDISGKENVNNKVTSWSSPVTDTSYPSEKLVKNALDGKAASSHTHTTTDITNFPSLATVATSGSYNDLSNKPTIPAAQVNSDWNATTGAAEILNKPTIPTVNNATLTIQKNGTNVATFGANASSNVTANIAVPTKVSDLTNDSGFTTNTGTVTSVAVKMNNTTKGTVTSSGTIDLGTVITAHQDISGKMDKANPTGTGALSINRKANTTVGTNSITLGNNCEATASDAIATGDGTMAWGSGTHTEGGVTIATAIYAHAEGEETMASGRASHAEGYDTVATGNYSHAEGQGSLGLGSIIGKTNSVTAADATTMTLNSVANITINEYYSLYYQTPSGIWITDVIYVSAKNTSNNTITLDNWTPSYEVPSNTNVYKAECGIAVGDASHVEGQDCAAIGDYSHAEGCTTVARGDYTHAEGYSTKANSDYQHVQGKYNIEDTNGTYADIIGGGTYNTPANLETVDWNGNMWLAGTINAAKGLYITTTAPTAANTGGGMKIAVLSSEPATKYSGWLYIIEA